MKENMNFRTYMGGEFVFKDFNDFCDSFSIKRHLTAPYTPQQNGVVERRNRTMLEMARSIVKHMHMPHYLWGEAIRHSTYLLNRVATRALKEKTPYEGFRNKKPNIEHLRVFGCIEYAKVDKKLLKKLDDRARMLVHLGTEPGSKAYHLLDPQTRKIVISRDVVFDKSRGWNWSEVNMEEQSIGDFMISIGKFGNYGVDDHIEKEEQLRLKQGTSEEEETVVIDDQEEMVEEETQVLRRSERQHNKPKYLDDYILLAEELGEEILMFLNHEPQNFGEAKDSKEWRRACEEEIISIEKNDTWILLELPYGAKAIGLKWVFKIKRNSDGSINKYKSRLVA